MNFWGIISGGAYSGPGATDSVRAALAVSRGLLLEITGDGFNPAVILTGRPVVFFLAAAPSAYFMQGRTEMFYREGENQEFFSNGTPVVHLANGS